MINSIISKIVLIACFSALCSSCKDVSAAGDITPGQANIVDTIPPDSPSKPEGVPTLNQNVWICKSAAAKKYHTDSTCSGLKRCKQSIGRENSADAEAVGLTQCALRKCNSPRVR